MNLQYLDGDFGKSRTASRRETVFAKKGMVCTSQPLAAQAGLDALKAGGNAIDAAITAAAAMTVLEPTSNGLGSDAFAILWIEKEKKLIGLNASGKAPMGISLEEMKKKGYASMPDSGWDPVMVPGAPAAWAKLTADYGRRTLVENVAPAARYAEEGFPVQPTAADLWEDGFKRFSSVREKEGNPSWLAPWFDLFAPEGHAPKAGDIWKSPEMARSLRLIGETNAEAYYRGELADRMDAFSRETGGYLRKSDLADYEARYVEPISVNYRGFDVWEIPPNGDGIIVLMALNILKNVELPGGLEGRNVPEAMHRQMEALKLAFTDGQAYVSDPRTMRVTPEELLTGAYGKARAEEIGEMALLPAAGDPKSSGTIYLCSADEKGNMVSYIQSNYKGFGSGVVVPDTGISLQDRGFGFSLDEHSPNVIAPGKKAFHTIIPGFLTRDGKPVGPFGVMGGFMQPQGQLQFLLNLIDFGMNAQEALDAPRWQWVGKRKILVEEGFPEELLENLRARGHEIRVEKSRLSFGRGESIFRLPNGVLCGACEPRAAGTVSAW